MFQVQRRCSTRATHPLLLRAEERRPSSVVLDEANDTRFKAEGLSHRCAQTFDQMAW